MRGKSAVLGGPSGPRCTKSRWLPPSLAIMPAEGGKKHWRQCIRGGCPYGDGLSHRTFGYESRRGTVHPPVRRMAGRWLGGVP
jgi:hypothetical protein